MTYLASFLFGRAESISEDDTNELEKFEEQLKCMNPSRLSEIGRELINEGNYPKAELVYNRLSTYEKERASLYLDLLKLNKIIYLTKSPQFNQFSQKIPDLEFKVKCGSADKVLECMISSAQMHSEGNLSKEDILTIERLIDKTPFSEITIQNRKEFNQLYAKFKEYIFQNT
jgi:hypothetical protein